MKKVIKVFITLGLIISLFGCSNRSTQTKAEIIYFLNYSGSSLTEYQSLIKDCLENYTKENDRTISTFKLTGSSQQSFKNSLDLAVKAGAKLIVLTSDFSEVLLATHDKYPDLTFLLIDQSLTEEQLGKTQNIFTVSFNYYELGYLSGYLIPYQGITKVGLLDESEDQRSLEFVNGFANGLSKGSLDLGQSAQLDYYPISNKSSSELSQIIYKQILTSSDTMTYFGDGAVSALETFAQQSGIKFVGTGYSSSNLVYYYAYTDYQKLLDLVLEAYVRKVVNKTNYVYGYTDEVLYINYTAGTIANPALIAYQKLEAGLNDSSITIEANSVALSSLSLPSVTFKIN